MRNFWGRGFLRSPNKLTGLFGISQGCLGLVGFDRYRSTLWREDFIYIGKYPKN